MIHLYVKRHLKSGLLYFGKTSRQCPYSYLGSGKYWLRHLRVHGKDVETLHVWTFENVEECREFALAFSSENDIVKSSQWANLRPENGIDGAIYGDAQSPENIATKIRAMTGKKRGPMPEHRKRKISDALKRRQRGPKSDYTKLKQSFAARGENNGNFGKPLSIDARRHLSELMTGRVINNETKEQMKLSACCRQLTILEDRSGNRWGVFRYRSFCKNNSISKYLLEKGGYSKGWHKVETVSPLDSDLIALVTRAFNAKIDVVPL